MYEDEDKRPFAAVWPVGGTYAKDLKGSLVSLRIAVLEEVVPLLAD